MQVETPGNLHAVAPIHGTFIANYRKSQVRARRFHGKTIAQHSGLLFGDDSTGGGIFLTPPLLLMRWARTKTAAVSAPPLARPRSLAIAHATANDTAEVRWGVESFVPFERRRTPPACLSLPERRFAARPAAPAPPFLRLSRLVWCFRELIKTRKNLSPLRPTIPP